MANEGGDAEANESERFDALLRDAFRAEPRMPPPAESWSPPPEIAEFRLERRLGRGATAEVWLAKDTLLDRVVALKIASSAASAAARARFRVEARAVAKLQHPNLLAIHYVGEVEERPFLVTEFAAGQSLDEIERPVPSERVVAIGIDLARGLSAAHRAGVLHRDIKPANAFLRHDGGAMLLDFGLAKLSEGAGGIGSTSTMPPDHVSPVASSISGVSAQDGVTFSGRLAGTPLYMAPETWRGEAATRSTDVYSLGALLYELLTGEPPCNTRHLQELRMRVLAGKTGDLSALAPAAPASLIELIRRCLRTAPAERPTADEVCDALARITPPRLSAQAEALDDPTVNPYRGLLAFGPEHRALFFGRDAEAATIVAELRASPFVLVAGSSGVGKSSLVRAGVVPRVERGALGFGERTRTVIVVPGGAPTDALAQAIAPVLGATGAEVAAHLASSPAWLADEARAARVPVLLVIDQLEEVWTLAGAHEREAFFAILWSLARSAPTVRVVATLRADFLGRLEDMGELQAQALRALVLLRPMSPEGLRSAIVDPALRRGVTTQPELVEHLVAHAEEGALPLLEFALDVLYARRDSAAASIGLADLERLGGVEGALATHADAAFARLGEAQQSEARRLLLALVTVERTRSRREERDLLGSAERGDTRAALQGLVEARIVVVGAGEHGAAYEVAHEALLSGWPALRGWLDEEAAAREAAERLRRAATEWERVGRTAGALFGERQLGELDVLGNEGLDGVSAAFVAASRAALRRTRLRRWGVVFGIPALVVVLGATAWGVSYGRHRAAIARALGAARAIGAKAEGVARAAEETRAGAIAKFEKDDLGPAEELWKKMLALEEDADRERREVEAPVDEALALDPGDRAARALFADMTLARLLAAERLHKGALLRELRARLDVYDDGSRAALLRAPAHVRVDTEPPGATLTLARYREDEAGRLLETDRDTLAAGVRRELDAGSYLIVAQSPERYPTRYPFLVRRGEESTLRVILPRASDVPEGMVYVPAGRTLYGSIDDETSRESDKHQPAHEIELDAFFIARTEVTNADYVAYLLALPESERKANTRGRLKLADDGRIVWKWHNTTLAPGQLHCNGVEPCVDWYELPVDCANREDGERYAAWLSQSGGLPGARLCNDREWERAARGADDRQYTNGNGVLGPNDACTIDAYKGDMHRAGPCAVGTHPASRSPFGVEDLAGSEWEWTSGPADVAQPKGGVGRGAAWLESDVAHRISYRMLVASLRYVTYGIRICASAK